MLGGDKVENPLVERSIEFSVEMIHYYEWMKGERKEYVLSKQILKSGTSVGANIHEANFAVSKADFIAKMQIALKEAYETQYWLTILEQTGYLPQEYQDLKEKSRALMKMLIATLNTSRK